MIRFSKQLRHFGVCEADEVGTGEHGVALFSNDGKVHWLFTHPDTLDMIAEEIRVASVKLRERKRGAAVHDLEPKRKVEIYGKKLLSI